LKQFCKQMSAVYWKFNSAAPARFRFRKDDDNDVVWFVEFEAASVGLTFAKCTDQGPGNNIVSVLLAGIDDFAQEYFCTTLAEEPRVKRARKAPSAPIVRDNAELPLDMYLECVLGDDVERDRVGAFAADWFGGQHVGGVPCAFLSTSAGRSVVKYRLWVFGRRESTMALALDTAVVGCLTTLADRQTWVNVCKQYRRDLPISALAGARLDSSANSASPQHVLDAAAQLGAAALDYVSASGEWRFPDPTRALRVPLELLIAGDGVRCNFLRLQPPLTQYGATVVLGQRLVAHKQYRIDTLMARLAEQSPVGETVARWLMCAPRRFSAQFDSVGGDAALSPFANHLARQVALFDSALGAFRCHTVLLTALLASHTAYQPASRGLRVHVLLSGPFDQSKSFVIDKVAQMSVPGTVAKLQRVTPRAFENGGPVRDEIKLIDELSEIFIEEASKSDAKAVFKSMLTSGEIHVERSIGAAVTARHDSKHSALIVGTNVQIAAIDKAIASRFIVVNTALTAGRDRRDGRNQQDQMERAGQANATAQCVDLCNDAQCMQALVLLTEAAIADGTLAEVSLSVLPHVEKAYATALLDGYGVELTNRQYQQVRALTRTLAIHAALHWLYTDPSSPCRGAPLSVHHILLLQPLLFDSVQLCCVALDLVASHVVPAAQHSDLMERALRQLAVRPGRLLCGYSAADDEPYALATRTVAPNVHVRAAGRLNSRAIRERFTLVGMSNRNPNPRAQQ
jgi:hypothetical protein